ncbi:MAG: phosphoribosylformylglycinamidine synthase subunit PurL [Acidimicrobiales bacterium]|nr:MAG: phosphoribosylformylglycinamidine synthase subunit PurL [Acidimicrobiales bacterium]
MSSGSVDVIDTVTLASQTADQAQPYAQLGLEDDEYARIHQILGRRPTQTELAMYSVMWSEHCSYKSSKVHLRQFGEKAPASDALLVGMGENAGVIDVGGGLAVTFKIESHNHPSYVEPYQGAATGVGGIVRDILTMGARPVAVMDSLRFGAPEAPDTARVANGIIAGVAGYGNCLGLPNIGGEVVFDPCYQGNPLVNALCVGVMPVDRIQRSAARGVGNLVVLLGAKTGRDGIGGVSVLASAAFDQDTAAQRPSVQVGDPFTEKLLIECCLELFERELVVGIQDLGGAGLTCATTETAAAGRSGMRVHLERVPLREASMLPHEILASESQERMLAIVRPGDAALVLSLAQRWGVHATLIGEITDGERLVITWHGEAVVDVPPASLADEGPAYQRPMRRPADFDAIRADDAGKLPRPHSATELRDTLLTLAASPNLCSRKPVTQQYDRYVGGNTVLAQPADAGLLRIDEQTQRGIALAVDGNGRYARLDPYAGAQLALAEAYRNVATSGARPIAVTNCLNFGSPQDPEVMWQFEQAVSGLADGCRTLGIPVTGGNVSFYNQTGETPISPTPVIGVLGVSADVTKRIPSGLGNVGDAIVLLGQTRDEVSGSEWAWVAHQHLGGVPPVVDFAAEAALAAVLTDAGAARLLTGVHDLSDGGLAQALVEACLYRRRGAYIELPPGADAFMQLFSESSARALVCVPDNAVTQLRQLCAQQAVPYAALGVVTAAAQLELHHQFTLNLDELASAHATVPTALR